MSTISLCMIVKDEARVIERCLRSVLPFLDSWTVVDTGSSDDTPAIVESVLGHLPGQLHHRPWRNFADNRSEAFELNRGLADYHLVVDADDWLEPVPGFCMPDLTADSYALQVHYNGVRFVRPQLFRSALLWRFEGAVHEYAACPEARSVAPLDGLKYVCSYGEGARSRDPQKYLRDAQLLESALEIEPEHTRNLFYLAQSYRDAGLWQEAAEVYLRRSRLAGWSEERYVSHLERARLLKKLQFGNPLVQAELMEAYQLNPNRAEALVELAKLYRESGHWHLSHLFANRACELRIPLEGLFLEEAAYQWSAQDELALAEFYTGRYLEARDRTLALLQDAQLPEIDRARLQQNLLHCRARCEGRAHACLSQ